MSPAAFGATALERLLGEPLDWDLVVEQAIAHGVATRLCEGLRSVGEKRVPAAAWQRLERHYFSVVALNLPRLEQLIEALDALGKARVEAVAFKGPLLTATLEYDPLTRESTDLDVLVERSALARASEVLVGCRYLPLESARRERDARARPLQKHYLFEPEDASLAMIEIHAEVMEPEWAVELPTGELLRRSVPVALGGTTQRQLCSEDLLLALALHGTSHGWRRLMWLSDLASLLSGLSEECVLRALERATAIGCRRILVTSCVLARHLLSVPPSKALDSAARRDPPARAVASRLARTLARPLVGSRAMRLPLLDRLRVRERPGDSLTSVLLHGRRNWFHLAERLSPLRFGDGRRPTRNARS